MAQKHLDPTNNAHLDKQIADIEANFKDIYGGGVSTGPTGPTGPTGTTAVAHAGTFVANGASVVTITDANVTANSAIIITLKTVGGTVSPSLPVIKTITAATGFTVTATAGDTSTYNYGIIG